MKQTSYSLEQLTTDELIAAAQKVADERADGHLTLLRFTTHWKICLGTIDLEGMPSQIAYFSTARLEVAHLEAYKTLREALIAFVLLPLYSDGRTQTEVRVNK